MMRTVDYSRHWSLNKVEKITGEIYSLLLDYPYSFPYADKENDIRIIPTLNYLNELFTSGGDSGGMSPGCTWERFEISQNEYDELVLKLLNINFENLKENHPYAPQKLIFDEVLNKQHSNKEEWEKYQILKYNGVHEFIQFYGDF